MTWVTTARTLWVGDEPVVGLGPMREEESDRFFGRSAEIAGPVERFRRHPSLPSSCRLFQPRERDQGRIR